MRSSRQSLKMYRLDLNSSTNPLDLTFAILEPSSRVSLVGGRRNKPKTAAQHMRTMNANPNGMIRVQSPGRLLAMPLTDIDCSWDTSSGVGIPIDQERDDAADDGSQGLQIESPRDI
jgi:hypothetical protein